ncbi:LacI family DNA-binding transcriptional regulator [Streptomyces sp. NPDC093094]|uniref:LacI family DNA-binding transcriptional regulator n=1 Tax=Streptomyces sp. NPDC093094 TaxID=3366026 RepID=UPI00380BA250
MVQIPKQSASSPSVQPAVPTSADVARLAGVSRATVSYVLNNTSAVRISEPTRRRVREAAEELGYVPHAAARSLRAGHSRTVLMPAPAVPVGPLYSQFLSDLQWALGRLDYTVVQYGTVGLTGDDAARAWAELRPVAVLVPGSGLGPQGVAVLKRSGARAVVTIGPASVDGAHALLMDHEEVGRAAGAHLHARGRRRVGVVVPAEPGLDAFSAPRLAGVRRALHGTGADVRELPLAYEEESAAGLAARWRGLGLDAVFAYNDEYAMLLMRALQDEGVRVPEDTAVIGADDLMLGRLLRPRLSTVHIELPSARDLAELVDRAVRDPGAAPETHKVLGATVIPRDST